MDVLVSESVIRSKDFGIKVDSSRVTFKGYKSKIEV